MPDVRLVDLEVIKRYSLAVRTDAVPAEELLEALDASRAVVMEAMRTRPRVRVAPRKALPKTRGTVTEAKSTRSKSTRGT